MANKHLITVDEFKTLARPVSVHIEEDEVMAFIAECEDMYIIPAIGYGNFKACLNDTPFDTTFGATFQSSVLIAGGEWENKEDKGCDAGKNVLQYCKGLKSALAYFVYAKIARADGSILTRTGFMRHDDDYAVHVDEAKNKQYHDIMRIAEHYLASCLLYAKYHSVDKTIKPVRGTRLRIHSIGD